MTTIRTAAVIDLRFPTSRTLNGSDAMNPDPDYSAAYPELSMSDRNGADGPGCYVRLYHSRAVPSNSRLRSWSLSPVVIASAESVTPW